MGEMVMKKWQVVQLADPQQALQLNKVEHVALQPGTVRIKVEAAALNFFDILQCQGKYQEQHVLPFTPGSEIAGVIEEVSENSTFQVGMPVMALTKLPNGGFAQSVVVDGKSVFEIPKSMAFTEAAAMFITYQTAFFALKRSGKLQQGETLLVHAGSGGVGSAAIQIGKAFGATVIATAGSDEKTALCKELGADVVINYEKEDFVSIVKAITNNAGANVIFDSVGGEVFQKSRKCIAFEGRILVIGFAGGEIPQVPVNHILIKNYSIVGVHWGYFNRLMPEQVIQAHKQLMRMYEEGQIKPLIYGEYGMTELPEALALLGNRKTYGKLILRPWS